MRNILKLGSVVALALLLCACRPEPPKSDAEPAAETPSSDAAAGAETMPTPPAGDALRGPEGMLEQPETPEQYKRAVDVTLQGAAFSKSGNDEDNSIGAPATAFGPQDSVYIELATQGTDSDYLITTRWIDPAGETLLENGRTVANGGTEKTVFSLSKPDGWAPGTYTVEVKINGKVAGQHRFTVR